MGTVIIKPCPFCDFANCKVTTKRRGNYKREGDNHQVLCGRCKARGPLVQDNQAEAIRLWNVRGLPPEIMVAVAKQIRAEFQVIQDHLGGAVEQMRAECWCETCRPQAIADMRMILCPDCGNKRCPRATNHINACTNSNEPGQPGSSYA